MRNLKQEILEHPNKTFMKFRQIARHYLPYDIGAATMDDLVQDALLKVLECRGNASRDTPAWAMMESLRRATNYNHHTKTAPKISFPECFDSVLLDTGRFASSTEDIIEFHHDLCVELNKICALIPELDTHLQPVARMVDDGYSIDDICSELNISRDSVISYRSHIKAFMIKAGLDPEIVIYWITRNG